MPGHPVQNDPQPRPVAPVDEVHQVLRPAVPAGGGEIPRHLIAPRAVQRVLHHRHELNVGVAHVLRVGDQRIRQLPVSIERPRRHVLLPRPGDVVLPPRAEVHLVNIQRLPEVVPATPRRHPLAVPPAVARELYRPGRRPRPQLGGEGIGVGLVQQLSRRRLDEVFIQRPLGHAGHKARPDAAADVAQPVLPRLPAGELAHHPDAPHPRRPHGEACAVRAVLPGEMGPQPAVAAAAFAPGEPGQLFPCHPAISPHALPPAACRPSFVSRGRSRPLLLPDRPPHP